MLPKQLVYELSEFNMVPDKKKSSVDIQTPRRPKLGSYMVRNQHFALFASWIDKKDDLYYDSKNNPYNFNLLYRASRDGIDTSEFHNKCDNKGATIVIAKMKGTDKIFGGYIPFAWDKTDSYKNTRDSFIYSFNSFKPS